MPPPEQRKGAIESLCNFLDDQIKRFGWLLFFVSVLPTLIVITAIYIIPLLSPVFAKIYTATSERVSRPPPETLMSPDQYQAFMWCITMAVLVGLIVGVCIRILRRIT